MNGIMKTILFNCVQSFFSVSDVLRLQIVAVGRYVDDSNLQKENFDKTMKR